MSPDGKYVLSVIDDNWSGEPLATQRGALAVIVTLQRILKRRGCLPHDMEKPQGQTTGPALFLLQCCMPAVVRPFHAESGPGLCSKNRERPLISSSNSGPPVIVSRTPSLCSPAGTLPFAQLT
jgi:hypothetical protein